MWALLWKPRRGCACSLSAVGIWVLKLFLNLHYTHLPSQPLLAIGAAFDFLKNQPIPSMLCVCPVSVGARPWYLNTLSPAPGSNKRKTRKGRGIAAGQGASCGFGMRGQKSRSGSGVSGFNF